MEEWMNTPVTIKNLSVSFDDSPVLTNVTCTIRQSELTVIVGRSGSGKSTLLRAVNRLNECFPGCSTTGDVNISLRDGQLDVYAASTSPERLRARVGMVFQSPNVLPVSIRRNMLLPQKLVRGIVGRVAVESMKRMLDRVGLLEEVCDRLDAPAATLSGGQQQRLCLARALTLEPEVLLLDEPTASVDYQSANRIEDLLLSLKNELPMLVVSHSLPQTQRLADRVLLMRKGKIAGEWHQGQANAETAYEEMLSTTF